MSDTAPLSPFARLDTNLMRSTKQEQSPTIQREPLTVPDPAEKQALRNTPASVQASMRASINASKHASKPASSTDLEAIRKTLKLVGKEVLYVRLTPEEKKKVSNIEYTYQQQGIKTSGNEIGRIALNFLLAEYKEYGEQSILAQVLAALHT